MLSKDTLRKSMNIRLQTIAEAEQGTLSQEICQRIQALPQYKKARRIMAFLSMPGEVCLDPLLEQAIREGREIYVPRCLSRGVMEAVRLPSLQDAVTGTYGIRTAPAGSEAIRPAALDLILVSGLAFDEQGHRLGRGAGFYDRFLTPIQQRPIVAVAWDVQLIEAVPIEAHDVSMPAILTEKRYILIGKH